MNKGLFWFVLCSAIGAFFVLGAAAIWMGGLNQDEGWYLYAANLVSEGMMPYRDFFYTQGPVLPFVYSAFVWVWKSCGVLGARIFTFAIGSVSVALACILAWRIAPRENRGNAALIAFLLLATNIYHLYYTAIPKTYALASLLVMLGMLLVDFGRSSRRLSCLVFFFAGVVLAFSSGTRISLGLLLPTVAIGMMIMRQWKAVVAFSFGGAVGLLVTYGPFVLDARALEGLIAAQKYHAARGGFDIVWTVGSVSRLVRWYLPVFVVMVMAWPRLNRLMVASFLVVFAFQMAAPFPYEDYQVPIIPMLAVAVAAGAASCDARRLLLIASICFGCSFGSPMLEKWTTNGQDRFWSLKKSETEMSQLRRVARKIEEMNPGGKTLLTQDLYLAIETNRQVPRGLEMGPFSMLTDYEWKTLLESSDCPVAALSGYAFAIMPPKCDQRPMDKQIEFWGVLKQHYELAAREEYFGQNATTLLILTRKK